MSRTRKFNSSDLSLAFGAVKKHVLNEVKKGRMKKVTKQYVLNKVATHPKIGLTGPRVLQGSEFKERVDRWYSKLDQEVEQLICDTGKEKPDLGRVSDTISTLSEKCARQQLIINELRKRVEQLTIENSKLLCLVIERFGKIDI